MANLILVENDFKERKGVLFNLLVTHRDIFLAKGFSGLNTSQINKTLIDDVNNIINKNVWETIQPIKNRKAIEWAKGINPPLVKANSLRTKIIFAHNKDLLFSPEIFKLLVFLWNEVVPPLYDVYLKKFVVQKLSSYDKGTQSKKEIKIRELRKLQNEYLSDEIFQKAASFKELKFEIITTEITSDYKYDYEKFHEFVTKYQYNCYMFDLYMQTYIKYAAETDIKNKIWLIWTLYKRQRCKYAQEQYENSQKVFEESKLNMDPFETINIKRQDLIPKLDYYIQAVHSRNIDIIRLAQELKKLKREASIEQQGIELFGDYIINPPCELSEDEVHNPRSVDKTTPLITQPHANNLPLLPVPTLRKSKGKK